MAAGGIAAGVYVCPFPDGEVSNPVDWFSGSNYIAAHFMMDLKDLGGVNPPDGRYKDRLVSEELSELKDGCWFEGSEGPVLSQPSPGPPWEVSSLNKYGGDQIGNPTDWVRYYQQQIANGSAPYQSCTETDTQKMTMNGCGTGPGKLYQTNEIKFIVERNRVTIFRGNGNMSGN